MVVVVDWLLLRIYDDRVCMYCMAKRFRCFVGLVLRWSRNWSDEPLYFRRLKETGDSDWIAMENGFW